MARNVLNVNKVFQKQYFLICFHRSQCKKVYFYHNNGCVIKKSGLQASTEFFHVTLLAMILSQSFSNKQLIQYISVFTKDKIKVVVCHGFHQSCSKEKFLRFLRFKYFSSI